MSAEGTTRAWIALGANLGDRRANLERAVAFLREAEGTRVLRVSPWIETAPVGGPLGQAPFLNGVLEAEVALAPSELLRLLQRIEAWLGRDRDMEVRNGPRPIDLDLLFYGDFELREPGLEVPHPRLEERTFVLEPLAALAPERRLPGCGRTVRERLDELRAGVAEGMR